MRVRVQRRPAVRHVDGHAAQARLAVDGAARRDERGDVGDRVAHPEPVAAAADVERLVQVAGTGRVDRDQLQVTPVRAARARRRHRGRLRLRLGVGREGAGHPQLLADPVEAVRELRRARLQAHRVRRDRPYRPFTDRCW